MARDKKGWISVHNPKNKTLAHENKLQTKLKERVGKIKYGNIYIKRNYYINIGQTR